MKKNTCVVIANMIGSSSEDPIEDEYYFPNEEAEEIIRLINEMFASKELYKYRAVKEEL